MYTLPLSDNLQSLVFTWLRITRNAKIDSLLAFLENTTGGKETTILLKSMMKSLMSAEFYCWVENARIMVNIMLYLMLYK